VIERLLTAKWVIGTYAFGAATIGLGVGCFILNGQNLTLRTEIQTVRIDLAQAKANNVVLESAIDDQNASLEALAAESQRRLDAANVKLAAAQKARKVAEGRVTILLDKPIPGSTLEERILAVDAMVLESLR